MKKWFLGSFLWVFLVLAFVSTPVTRAQSQDSKRSVDLDPSRKISMEFKGANLNDVLKILSQQSGLNFIAAAEVNDKKITLYLNEVPVDEALERILYANDLTYDMEEGSGIFIVRPLKKAPEELLTRIYRLKYASTSLSKINSTVSITGSSSGSSSSGSSSGSSSSSSSTGNSSSLEGGSSSAGTSSSSSSGGGIATALQAALSSSGKIVEDARTNSLIITDIPAQFPIIEQTLSRLDVPIPQILIEVEMLDVSKTTADKIGVKYGDTPLTFKGGIRDHYYPWDQNELVRKGIVTAPGYTVGTIDASGLKATLQFIRTQSDTKNLARPRILTLNNETAEIKISTNEAIGIRNSTTSSQAQSTSAVEAERVKTGVFLTVTPQANILTGEITMAIVPRVIQARIGGTFDGKSFRDPEERGSQSILKVDSGDTIMLGGLLRTDYTNTTTKIPLLGDIPFIGGAFRHKDKSGSERELIIFITPHIVRGEGLSKSTSKKYIVSNVLNSLDASSGNPQPVVNNPTESKIVPKQNFSARQKEIDKALLTIEKREP